MSLTRRESAELDELALYLANGAALATAMLVVGWGGGSARVGALGGALAAAGVWTSWQTREWDRLRRWLIGLVTGFFAALSLQALINWEISHEVGMLYIARGDLGLSMALRMAVLLVGLSYLLVTREMLSFSLVPAITLFGLAGGRAISAVAFGCFLVFLPAALATLGQAMLLSGLPAESRSTDSPGGPGRWRSRHWSILTALIATVLLVGTLIYVPVLNYGTQYYWPLAMMTFGGGGFGRVLGQPRQTERGRTYPVGEGPIAPSDTPVLSFRPMEEAAVPPGANSFGLVQGGLWRGEVFDIYTGRGWRSSDDSPTPLPVRRGTLHIERPFPPTPAATSRPAAGQAQVVRGGLVSAEQNLPLILYAPGQLQQASLPLRFAVPLSGEIYVDKFGCVSAPRVALPAGGRYRFLSDLLAFTRTRGKNNGALPPDELEESYLRIPLSSRRLADLARTITANAATASDKPAAITSYLQQECVYTLSTPAVPTGEDAADWFVFHSKRGYCDLFATALAVMARAVGIPTRLVIGYAGGQYDPRSQALVLRESDAHAWVEAYEPPYGWVSVDPAPAGGPVPLSRWQEAMLSLRAFVTARPVVGVAAALAGLAAYDADAGAEGLAAAALRDTPGVRGIRAAQGKVVFARRPAGAPGADRSIPCCAVSGTDRRRQRVGRAGPGTS